MLVGFEQLKIFKISDPLRMKICFRFIDTHVQSNTILLNIVRRKFRYAKILSRLQAPAIKTVWSFIIYVLLVIVDGYVILAVDVELLLDGIVTFNGFIIIEPLMGLPSRRTVIF